MLSVWWYISVSLRAQYFLQIFYKYCRFYIVNIDTIFASLNWHWAKHFQTNLSEIVEIFEFWIFVANVHAEVFINNFPTLTEISIHESLFIIAKKNINMIVQNFQITFGELKNKYEILHNNIEYFPIRPFCFRKH